jgi:hypothetical protein
METVPRMDGRRLYPMCWQALGVHTAILLLCFALKLGPRQVLAGAIERIKRQCISRYSIDMMGNSR